MRRGLHRRSERRHVTLAVERGRRMCVARAASGLAASGGAVHPPTTACAFGQVKNLATANANVTAAKMVPIIHLIIVS
jgi:hypothetical protein